MISGYYGFGNLGDEALLAIIVRELKRRYAGATIDVLSASPSQTSGVYGVEATPRMDVAAVRRAVDRADVVLSGGGGLLQDATSLRSLLYYAGVIRSAVAAGKPAMIFAQSIGPLDFWGRAVVKGFCSGVARATVRDERSRLLLSGILPKVPVRRTADPVFMLDDDGDGDLREVGLGPESDPLVVVSVRKIPAFSSGVSTIARAIDRLAERYDARVAFLPLGGPSDAEAATVVIRACASTPMLLPYVELPQAAKVIRRARLVIGMRLHALIIAARLGVPFLAIPYDPKVSALCEDLGWPLPPLWDPSRKTPTSDADVDALVTRAWTDRDALASQLREAAARMRELAELNFATLDELIGK